MSVDPRAGKLPEPAMLANSPRLMRAYYTERPDPAVSEQRETFGTSGHRGSALDVAFNEAHILAITQAICLYRLRHVIDGPLFLGIDTHALSESALGSALEVLCANGAYASVDDGGLALSAGFQAHIAKPLEPVELVLAGGGLARGVRTS
jgi:phosphoglucomutase